MRSLTHSLTHICIYTYARTQFLSYFQEDEKAKTPICMSKCIETSNTEEVSIIEPIGSLFLALLHCHDLCKPTSEAMLNDGKRCYIYIYIYI